MKRFWNKLTGEERLCRAEQKLTILILDCQDEERRVKLIRRKKGSTFKAVEDPETKLYFCTDSVLYDAHTCSVRGSSCDRENDQKAYHLVKKADRAARRK